MNACEECYFYNECGGNRPCNTFIDGFELLIQADDIDAARNEYEEYAEAYWDYISDGV